MRDDAHPALHSPTAGDHRSVFISPHSNIMGNSPSLKDHFVPEGWEDHNRGICPCGEVVVWNESGQVWLKARDYRVLVMSPDEVALLRRGLIPSEVRAQLALQDEMTEYMEQDA